jgi:hypothetical protein
MRSILKAFAATAALALAAGLPAVALAQDEVQQDAPPPNDAGGRFQPDESSAPPVRNWEAAPQIAQAQDRGGRDRGDRGGRGGGEGRRGGGEGRSEGGRNWDGGGSGGGNAGGGERRRGRGEGNRGGWTPPSQPAVTPPSPGQDGRGGWTRRDRDGDGVRNGRDRDRNGDGQLDPRFRDRDGDGVRNGRDRDRNGDGQLDRRYRDQDRDGVPNGRDRDRDGDGVRNGRDRNGGGWNGGNWNGGNGGWDRDRGGQWDRDRSRRRDYGDFRNRWNQDQWRRDWNRNRGYDWWRNDRGFRGYNGFRFGFYFAPGHGYYSVPRNYWGQRWYPGDYLPSVFWRYQLNDWRTFGLGFPPPGTQWVAVDNHIYLIDSYDGYIIEVIFDAWRW